MDVSGGELAIILKEELRPTPARHHRWGPTATSLGPPTVTLFIAASPKTVSS
jgi:hypothetical protein